MKTKCWIAKAIFPITRNYWADFPPSPQHIAARLLWRPVKTLSAHWGYWDALPLSSPEDAFTGERPASVWETKTIYAEYKASITVCLVCTEKVWVHESTCIPSSATTRLTSHSTFLHKRLYSQSRDRDSHSPLLNLQKPMCMLCNSGNFESV